MAFTGQVSITSSFSYTDSATVTLTTNATSKVEQTDDFEAGSGANQATIAYSRELTSAVAVNLDLNDGSLEDQVGRPVVLTGLAVLVIRNKSTATNPANLVVGDGASQPLIPFGVAGDVETIGPGGVLVKTWPITKLVVSATKKKLTITPSASCPFEIQLVGNA